METKKCCCCKEIKNIADFGSNASKQDGLQCACKLCKNLQNKKWRYNNKDANKTTVRKYQQKNKESIYHYQKKYNDNMRKNDPVKFYSKNTWSSLNQRCVNGSYANNPSVKTNYQHISYFNKGITLEITKEEYMEFWKKNSMKVLQIIHDGDKPSIDRINPNGNYSLDNIQIISLTENRRKDRVKTSDRYVYDKENRKIENRKRYEKTHRKEGEE